MSTLPPQGILKDVNRDAYNELLTWRNRAKRKPLLLQGARQTGKTWLLKQFGANEYEETFHCDFEREPDLQATFEANLDPVRIVSELERRFRKPIRPGKDLLIFDEIQQCGRAVTSLKYFCEEMPDMHLTAAGSLLGVKVSVPGSFPVGKTDFLRLHPRHFGEFLTAMDRQSYRERVTIAKIEEGIPSLFHNELIRLLRLYFMTGGMPAVAEGESIQEARRLQEAILSAYELDFAKHAPRSDIPKLSLIWNSIPKHLARENKKFVFSAMRKGARGREYESAIQWLQDASIIHKCFAVEHSVIPLAHHAEENCFKVYPVDVGLLGAMVGTTPDQTLEDQLFKEYKGALTEAYVTQQLVAQNEKSLYYWKGKGGRAELDFILSSNREPIPLEVKAGMNPKSKSLRSYDQQFSPRLLARANLLNLKHDGKILNIPLYALPVIREFLGQATI